MNSLVLNLPAQTTALIGRERQIDEVRRLLQEPDCRLLTLVGPGGIGKTRLAIAVAQGLPADQFEDSVVFVPLQAVTSPDLLPSTIADPAGITLAGHEPLPIQLLNNLRGKRLLLVLDNFEQLLAATDLLVEILQEAPNVKLLLTSREALSVREEWLYPVPGLSVPREDDTDDPLTCGAVELLVDRARQIRHSFNLEDEVEAVVSICQAVEGMPLAIELAASWLTVLDCAAIAERLQHSLDILATPLRNVPERHRSMVAVFDQSWQMLSSEERSVFSKLSVFQGGFTFEAAEEVAGATLPILSALIAKTLVRRDADGRYQIHELLRQCGVEKLAESPETGPAAHRTHSAYFMRLLDDRYSRFFDSRQLQAAQEIGGELDNVRKAWQWALDHMQMEWILKAVNPLHDVYQYQSRYLEGADLFLSASRRLETERMTVERGAALVRILSVYGWLCIRLGRLDEADHTLERARHLYDEIGISPGEYLEGYPIYPTMFLALTRGDYEQATTLGEELLRVAAEYTRPIASAVPHYGMASAALAQGDYRRAKSHAEQALALAASAGNQRDMTYPHSILGHVARDQGDPVTAKRHFEAAYMICEEYGEPGCMAEHMANLAGVALLQQEWREARALFARGHALYQEIGDRGGIARTRLGLGIVAQQTDQPDAACAHFSHALATAVDAQIVPVILSISAKVGDFLLWTDDTQTLGLYALTVVLRHPSCDEQTRKRVMDSLARHGLSAHELEPTSVTLDELVPALQIELAASEEPSSLLDLRAQPLVEPLTAREGEVLYMLADGRSNPEIAEELVVTVGTVKSHTSRIYRKLDVSNRTQAVVRARELGLLA